MEDREYQPDYDHYFDMARDEAILVTSKQEAEEYIKRYPSMRRYVHQWLKED